MARKNTAALTIVSDVVAPATELQGYPESVLPATTEVSGAHEVPSAPKAPRVRKPRTKKSSVEQMKAEEVDPRTLTVIESVSITFDPKNWKGAVSGFMGAAWVPVVAFVTAAYIDHKLLNGEFNYDNILAYVQMSVVIACLGFSLPKVAKFMTSFFQSALAGYCFAFLTEITMVVSPNHILSAFGLSLLIVINGVAAATALVLERRKEVLF